MYKAMWDELVGNSEEQWEDTKLASPVDLLEGKSDIDGKMKRGF